MSIHPPVPYRSRERTPPYGRIALYAYERSTMNRGIWYAVGAYMLWGILPIYWKALLHVSGVQITSHRIIWAFLILLIAVFVLRRGRELLSAGQNPRILLAYSATAILIAINWGVYIWAVNANLIIETSLGYYINPLLSVLVGVIVLRERLRSPQWLAIGIAAAGVIYLTLTYGRLPWVALTLAFSFTIYALIKKKIALDAFQGLTIETGVLLVPSLVLVLLSEAGGGGPFLSGDLRTTMLLIGAGLATTAPPLLFVLAAQRISLSLIGILQYLSPTMQFLLDVFLYHEPFSHNQLIGFSLVWLALVVFGAERLAAARARPAATSA